MRLVRLAYEPTLIWIALALAACGPSASTGDDVDATDNGPCTEPARRCVGNTFQVCAGTDWVDQETCPDACDTNLGCVLCVPGTGTCEGMTSHACRPDGQGYFDEFCDPVMGSTCNPDTGVCEGACAAFTLGSSYIGCDYYPTQMTQLVNPSFQFAVAVSNTSGSEAQITIDGGVLTLPINLNVQPGAVAVQYLPWVPALKRCMTEGLQECGIPESYGALAVDGAYHLRSTRPVTVYQFSALDYAFGGKFSYSNDASLLLPTNVWTGNYVAPAWTTWTHPIGVLPGSIAITAQQDNTSVMVNSRATTTGGDGAPSFSPNAPQTVTLNSGDVLMLMSTDGDLTGSTVTADKKVQVIGGHHCTQVPIGYTACDHIEESVFPVEALSDTYLVTAPTIPAGGARTQITRVIAAQANTTVDVDPPSVGGPYTLAAVGDFVEISNVADMAISANNKIIVSHYMVGQDAPPAAGIGDPSYTLSVPIDQYRASYQFHAPINYDNNYVNVTAPTGEQVTLDGLLIDAGLFTPVAGSGYSVARVALADNVDGNHTIEGSAAFGITVYGYGQYTSYWYPGGLDLTTIPVD
jgi:hypothetical protein